MPAKYIQPKSPRKPSLPPLPHLGAEAGPTTVGRVSGRTTVPERSSARSIAGNSGALQTPLVPSPQTTRFLPNSRVQRWTNRFEDQNLLSSLMRPAAGFDETPASFAQEQARREHLLRQLRLRGRIQGA